MMDEYIKRADAINARGRSCDRKCAECDFAIDGDSWCEGEVFVVDLLRIPAADVREVVRGKWSIHEIYKHEMSYGVTGYEPVYKCSVCGRLMESYLRFDEPIMPEDASFPRFCPNCGADMREGN